MDGRQVRLSKFLALVLRHDPGRVGVTLDPEGWVGVDELLRAAGAAGVPMSRHELVDVVLTNPKQRFTLDPDGNRIRANQGHSLDVDLRLDPLEPPDVLFHGTSRTVLAAVLNEGLRPMGRRHVHLCADRDTAVMVGRRHGPPVVLTVASGRMHADGHRFFRSVNGVWLAERVPPSYLRGDDGPEWLDG